jgi:hypothetical protein
MLIRTEKGSGNSYLETGKEPNKHGKLQTYFTQKLSMQEPTENDKQKTCICTGE